MEGAQRGIGGGRWGVVVGCSADLKRFVSKINFCTVNTIGVFLGSGSSSLLCIPKIIVSS